jgi:hypothetical protein
MIGLHDMMDTACAERLGVSVEDYIRFVEEDLTEERATIVICCLLDEESTPEQIEKCKRIYNITKR